MEKVAIIYFSPLNFLFINLNYLSFLNVFSPSLKSDDDFVTNQSWKYLLQVQMVY